MNLGYVIAIDGPSGAGKSTVARELARKLGYRYIDTGAMYRAVALAADRQAVDLTDAAALRNFLPRVKVRQELDGERVLTLLDDEDVSEAIRRAEMGLKASAVSARPEVRDRLRALQREMGRAGGVVMEGRDIGTVIFPDADYKFFLVADDRERARRRHEELRAKGEPVEFSVVLSDLQKRDHQDSTREVAPLRRAPDATLIDSTGKSVSEVVEEILQAVGGPGGAAKIL